MRGSLHATLSGGSHSSGWSIPAGAGQPSGGKCLIVSLRTGSIPAGAGQPRKLRQVRTGPSRPGSIPAGAGQPLAAIETLNERACGLSPRVRGSRRSGSRSDGRSQRGLSPRVRGSPSGRWLGIARYPFPGLSPRVRGSPFHAPVDNVTDPMGSIPAGAGQPPRECIAKIPVGVRSIPAGAGQPHRHGRRRT